MCSSTSAYPFLQEENQIEKKHSQNDCSGHFLLLTDKRLQTYPSLHSGFDFFFHAGYTGNTFQFRWQINPHKTPMHMAGFWEMLKISIHNSFTANVLPPPESVKFRAEHNPAWVLLKISGFGSLWFMGSLFYFIWARNPWISESERTLGKNQQSSLVEPMHSLWFATSVDIKF